MKATKFDVRGEQPVTPAQMQSLSSDEDYCWVDLRAEGAHDSAIAPALGSLGFSEVLQQYLARTDASGMFQVVGDSVVGATWCTADGGDIPALVHFVWDAQRIVTVRSGGDEAMEAVAREIVDRGPRLFAQPTVVPGVLLGLILSSLDDRLTEISGQIADIDSAIIVRAEPGQITQLRVISQELAPLNRRLPVYLDEVKQTLVAPSTLPGIDANGGQFLQAYQTNVQDTVSRVGDASDAARGAVQDYQSELSNKQGNRINQLTIVSMIFLPVTFITGYFGMNFQWLDNLLLSLMSWILLGVIVPILTVVFSMWALSRHGYVVRKARHRRRARQPSHSGGAREGR